MFYVKIFQKEFNYGWILGLARKFKFSNFLNLAQMDSFWTWNCMLDHSVYMFRTFHLLIYLFECCSGPLFVSFIGIWWSSIMPKRAAEGELHPLQRARARVEQLYLPLLFHTTLKAFLSLTNYWRNGTTKNKYNITYIFEYSTLRRTWFLCCS